MASGIVLIGTRVLGLPFWLAGVTVRVAAAGEAAAALSTALSDGSRIVLLAPDCAAELPAATLTAARRAGRPLILVLPGALPPALDVRARVRRALGL